MYELIHKKYLLYFFLIFFPTFCFAQVYINEVNYSTQSKAWVEIFNNTDSSVDITQYKILDDGAHADTGGHAISAVGGSNFIPPHEYGVIAKDPTLVSASYLFKASLGIKTTGEYNMITLKKGTSVNSVPLSDSSSMNNNSLQLQLDSTWIVGTPTPGAINSSTSNTSSDTSTSTQATTTAQTDNTQNNNSNLSSHTSYVEVSTYKPPEMLSVTIGRDRLASIGISTEFEVKSNITMGNVNYHWTFGDGASAEGRRVEHVYEYAGDYVVVMNAKYFEDVSVSRTNIKVTEPKLSIEEANNNYIKIKNNSAYEINLYGWKLYFEGKAFVFPVDTIILSLASTEFSSKITGFHPSDLSQVMLSTNDKPVISNISSAQTTTPKVDQISELYKKAVQIKNELASLETNEVSITQTKVATTESKKEINLNNLASPIVSISSTTEPINNWFSIFKRFLFKRN